jgi:hypothetical protein
MKKLGLAILLLTIVSLSACEDATTKPCSEERTASAIISDFPDSIKVGVVEHVAIKFILENSCGDFDRFELTNTDEVYKVCLITTYEGCNCTQEFSEESVEFDIDIDFPGSYEFKFWVAEEEYESYGITVFE